MKFTKKKVLLAALAICLIAVVSMGTLAWFNASDSVKNEFQIANSDDLDADELFSIDVWENTPDGDKDQDGYVYEKILPGDVLKKEARVENTGYYDQYVRVTVTVSNAQDWIAALGANFNPADVFKGFEASDWTHVWNNLSEDPNADELIYVLYYKDKLASGSVIEVFDNIIIPDSLTQEQLAKFDGKFFVDVKAQAVQTENVVPEGTADADVAWAAFKTVES